MANMFDPELEQQMREYQGEYSSFLDDAAQLGVYSTKVQEMIAEGRIRLTVNINDLRKTFPKRAANLLKNGFQELVCLQRALKEMVANIDSTYGKNEEEFFVAFEGSFGHRHVNPRTLKSNFLANMVCCEGIVTKCSMVRPKVVRSVHYCPNTKKTIERRYTDLTSYEAFPTSSVYPTEDENKNPLETEYGLSVYKDHQTFTIQEMPETAPAGQLPRSVDIVADSDLVDRCKPGDRVRIIGMFRCLPSKQQGFTAGTFRTILIANNIQLLSKEAAPNYHPQDITVMRKFAKQINAFEKLARSLAPSICGHLKVKEAILCMLLGGNEKVLLNGSRLRGDINVLLVGDPSVAKSQLLRYVLHTAPRAIATTGRGSSGVGLTAAVTSDPETGDRRLEAGAMVLADRGVVCIDEFDKMSDLDRTAIHEVMEQGRVTIAKAGIHAKLNARCAVLAAANPVYGRYDQSKNPMENIGMQDSLLSRFDLLFILLDKHIKEDDTAISNHVVEMHRYRAPGEEDGSVLPMGAALETLTTEELDEDEAEKDGPTPVYEKNDAWIPGKAKNDRIISMQFMRKYIQFAKALKPVLSEAAGHYIGQKYAELRESENKRRADHERVMPVTARTLETLIRISTAYAKARLAADVTEKDAECAYKLLHYACFREELRQVEDEEGKKVGKKRRRNASGDSVEENEADEAETPVVSKPKKDKKDKTGDVYDFDEDSDADAVEPPVLRGRKRVEKKSLGASQSQMEVVEEEETEAAEVAMISVDRYVSFRKLIRRVFDAVNAEMLPVEQVKSEARKAGFSDPEIRAGIERLSDDNAAMVSDDKMILI